MRAAALPTTICSRIPRCITGNAQHKNSSFLGAGKGERMDEKRIKELFQQTGETLQAILEYFRLKDKVLWTGSAGKGKTITVPNLSKYSLIRIKAVYGDFLVNTSAGRVRGIYGDRQGSSDTLVTGLLFASISGDSLTINNCNWVVHSPSGSHGAISQTTITEIIGIDPVIPTALQNIIRGGGLHKRDFRRWQLCDCLIS